MPAQPPRIKRDKVMDVNTPTLVADTSLVTLLSKHSQPHLCIQDETLFSQGESPDAVYLLEDGQVTLTSDAAGEECVYARQSLPGSIFGLPGVISNAPYSLTATATSGTHLQMIPRETFQHLLSTHPEISFQALRILAAEVQTARRIVQKSIASEVHSHRSGRSRASHSVSH